MIGLLMGLFGSNPAKTAATWALIFVIGFAVGENWVTGKAISLVQEHADRQFAAATGAIADQHKEFAAKLVADQKQALAADEEVHASLESAMSEAERDRDAALQQIAAEKVQREKDREIIDGLKGVNKMLAEPFMCGSADTRRLLDAAAGAGNSPGPGIADASAAGRTSSPAQTSPAAPLECDQLLRGYPNLAVWGREGWDKYEAWQRWARERLAVP